MPCPLAARDNPLAPSDRGSREIRAPTGEGLKRPWYAFAFDLQLPSLCPIVAGEVMGKVTRQQSKQILRDAGLRATAPRAAVLRLLSDAERPLSHAEVVEALGTDDWDAATLYRNLVKLNEVGLARVASRVGGVTRFAAQEDGTPTHVHPHFACRDCGSVRCLEEAQVSLPASLKRWREALADAEVQLVGQCPECRNPSAKRPRRQSRTGRS